MDQQGNIFVCGSGNNRIHVYEKDSNFQAYLGPEELFICPMEVIVNSDNELLVLDGDIFIGGVECKYLSISKWVSEDHLEPSQTFRHQPHKMVKHTQTIRRQQPTNCLNVFDHLVGLALQVACVVHLKLAFTD